MKKKKSTRFIALCMAMLLLLSLLPTSAIATVNTTAVNNATAVKNVILMIGDGMGLNHVKAAEMTNLLSIAGIDAVTTVTTRSSDAEVTDSAAASTALSCGIKTNNNYVGLDPNGNQVETMTEYAHSLGMRTGLVATEILPHATPAGFSAHEIARWNYDNIAKDQMASGIDVMFGGGSSYFDNLSSSMGRAGYGYYKSFNEVPNKLGGQKILGAFGSDAIPQVYDSNQPTGYPTLSAMTSKALNLLDNDNGFFLMVEGSKIDSYAHGSNLPAMISEAQAFDLAIKAVKDYVETHSDTLLIVTADHETGGLKPDGTGWKFTAGNNHTAADVGVWAYGAGADALNNAGSINNTDIAAYIRKGLELYNGRTATTVTGNTVAFKLPSNCSWDKVWVYAWDDNSYYPLGGWPGSQMTYDTESGLYFLTSDQLLATDKLIFSNGGSGGSNQSENITGGISFYTKSNQTVYTLGTASGSGEKWPVITDTTGGSGGDTARRVYFENTQNWSTVRLYAWDNNDKKPLGNWDNAPTMQQINGTNLWYYEETAPGQLDGCNIIFRSSSRQSENITNGIQFDDWVYSVSKSTVDNKYQVICEKKDIASSKTNRRIYFDNGSSSDNMYLYAWGGNGEPLGAYNNATAMTYDTSSKLWYYDDADGKLSGCSVIFKNSKTESGTLKTPDISADKVYYGAVYSMKTGGTGDKYKVVSIEPTYTVTYQDNLDGQAFATEVYSGLRYGDSTPHCSISQAGTLDKVEGYTFKGWDSSVAPTVTGDVTYTAQYEPSTYTVTVQTDGNGTASASAVSAAQGTAITLSATPNSGYRLKEWQVVSGNVNIVGDRFTMPAAAVTVKAIFEEETDDTPDTHTIYFNNTNSNWDSVCIWYWGGRGGSGKQLTMTLGENGLWYFDDEDVVLSTADGMLFFPGNDNWSHKTADIPAKDIYYGAIYKAQKQDALSPVIDKSAAYPAAALSSDVYLTVIMDSHGTFPSEPSVSKYTYASANSNYYVEALTNNNNKFSEKGSSNVIDMDAIFTENQLVNSSISGDTTIGIYDSTGVSIKRYLKTVDWGKFRIGVAEYKNVMAMDGQKVTSENSSQYKIIPYVIKYQDQETASPGWHIDCMVVPKTMVTLGYEANLPTGIAFSNASTALPEGKVGEERFEATVGAITVGGQEVAINSSVPAKRDGKTVNLYFLGWNTQKDGSGKSYLPGSAITVSNDTTLYAIWSETQPVTLSYDANLNGYTVWDLHLPDDVTGAGKISTTVGTAKYGENPINADSTGIWAYRPGDPATDPSTHVDWYFQGWNTKADGSGDCYFPGQAITVEEGTTLYAIWDTKPIQTTYTVSYKFVEGSETPLGVDPPASATLPANTSYTATRATAVSGYTFNGWYTDPGLTNKFVDGTTVTASIILYGQYKKNSTPIDPTKLGALVISKTVTNGGSTSLEFTFTVTLTGASETYSYTGSKTGTIRSGGTLTLRSGQSVSINGLPEGTVYTVTETPVTGYSTAVSGHDANNPYFGSTATGTITSGSAAVVHYTNIYTGGGGSSGGGSSSGGSTSKPSVPSKPSTGLNTENHYSYIIGYKDGTLRPYGTITRGEVATIFFRLLTDETREQYWSQTNNYSDCGPVLWCNNAISTLSNMGIIDGYMDGTFRPYAKITRAQFAKIAVGFFETTKKDYQGFFSDVNIGAWYTEYVEAAARVGLIQGFEDGTFRPDTNITRAQACVIVNRALGRKPGEEHLLDEDEMLTWVDNNPGDWYYADMQEATNSHDYTWLAKGSDKKYMEEWTEKLPQRDWAALEHAWSTAHSAPGGEAVR